MFSELRKSQNSRQIKNDLHFLNLYIDFVFFYLCIYCIFCISFCLVCFTYCWGPRSLTSLCSRNSFGALGGKSPHGGPMILARYSESNLLPTPRGPLELRLCLMNKTTVSLWCVRLAIYKKWPNWSRTVVRNTSWIYTQVYNYTWPHGGTKKQ